MFVTAAHLYPDIESCAKAYDRVIVYRAKHLYAGLL
ncbi:hypothetical protein OOU_Y34scaffold00580g31 [Pyricularia oryzae Y34]|uniref:Uncharacterized protein n=2 Tax=Pyricularia oryzae TaxID=318829 RepID=A0AA97PK74_PYRO3|nr:hypothetical protein OOU_Y34scaffold00580g31 [Pyricularia oryzae Y34]